MKMQLFPAATVLLTQYNKNKLNKDITAILDGYSTLKYDKIVIRKLDETTNYGTIFN